MKIKLGPTVEDRARQIAWTIAGIAAAQFVLSGLEHALSGPWMLRLWIAAAAGVLMATFRIEKHRYRRTRMGHQ